MLSHEHRFVFIHVNKSGGTSIAQALGVETDHPQPGRALEHSRDKTTWSEYFKFAFVRDPWDKECSDYHFHRRLAHKAAFQRQLSFEEYFRQPEFHPLHPDYFWHSDQVDWLRSENHEIELDFIGRYENLQGDFDAVCDAIGVPRRPLPHSNRSEHDGYARYYTPETREAVAQLYAKDIEYFGYRFQGE